MACPAKTRQVLENPQPDINSYDPEIASIIRQEKNRQRSKLELIASENYASKAVLQALGSCMNNKYSEGQPGHRFYGGTEIIDKMELLTCKRTLEAYSLNSDEWGANVQALSGSPANFIVYTALLQPKDRIMGLNLPEGGHFSHGFYQGHKKWSATSIYFETLPFTVDPVSGLIDYEKLAENARLYKPKMIIAGISCYSRHLDYKRFRDIADEVGAYLLGDMAHVSGLVAAGVSPSPFEYCDVVTSTTHKTLRGPRSGIIFYRKGVRKVLKNGEEEMYNFEGPINEAVFPGLQSGPHNHAIAALAVALKEAREPEFKVYQKQVIANAKALCSGLKTHGYTIVTGGTDNHQILIDLRPLNIDGVRVEKVLEAVGMTLNKMSCPGDTSTSGPPRGLRFGTPALTSRNLKEDEFQQIAEFIHRGITLALEIYASCGPDMEDFLAKLEEKDTKQKITDFKKETETFVTKFPLPGFDDW